MDAHTLPPQEKTLLTHQLLNEAYKRLPLDSRRSPMHELISTMLSHRTNHADEEKAYYTMLERFGDWEGVLHADAGELADAIKSTRYPGQKAPQIQQTLRRIKEERGEISIDFLNDMPVEEAMAWLTRLPGVGLKTATLLLLFNFKKPVLPVDSHVFRVSQRVGLIGAKVTANKVHDAATDAAPECRRTLQFPQAPVLARPGHLYLLQPQVQKVRAQQLLQLLSGCAEERGRPGSIIGLRSGA